jgi:cytochrome P450
MHLFKRIMVDYSDTNLKNNLFTATRHDWRRMRSVMNPAFASARLKEVFEITKSNYSVYIKKKKKKVNFDHV